MSEGPKGNGQQRGSGVARNDFDRILVEGLREAGLKISANARRPSENMRRNVAMQVIRALRQLDRRNMQPRAVSPEPVLTYSEESPEDTDTSQPSSAQCSKTIR